MIGDQPPDDDAAERGISSARVRQLLAEVDAEQARQMADPEPVEAASVPFTPPPRAAAREQRSPPARKPQSRLARAARILFGLPDPAPPPAPQRPHKTTFFTYPE
jgi:hypothetical protein